ncbi:MAG: multiheme c-type cytochrome [Motiliproteus sp.]
MRLILLLLLAFTLPAYAAQSLQLLYSGNLDGELEPCGCSLDTDYGGLQRRATLIDQLLRDDPELLLISTGGLFSPEPDNKKIKHGFILTGMAQLNYDAIGIQWTDLVHGEKMLLESGLPFAVGNWKSEQIARSNTSDRAADKLFFSQWLDPLSSTFTTMQSLSPISTETQPLQDAFRQAKQQGKLTVLATTLELDAAQQLFDLSAIDILITKAAYEAYGEPQRLGNTLVLQPGSRGQRLGLLKLELNQQQRITSWQHQVIDLPDTIADAPQLDSWYADYNDALRQDYLERVQIRKALNSGESPYLGQQQCLACHAEQHQIWSQSEHAKAFDDLVAVGKSYDSECVSCHSVGFQQSGGYLDQELTSNLAAVQCESCHGAGREHAASAGKTAVPNKDMAPEQICAQCHTRDHSPAFNIDTYWPKIAHPGKPVLASDQ